MESLKNAKCVLESPCKVLEVFVQKRVRTLTVGKLGADSEIRGQICKGVIH